MNETIIGWKAFRGPDEEGRWDCRNLGFLYHGLGGSRHVPVGTWMVAKAGILRDGVGQRYRSGFHFVRSLDDARAFDRLTKGKYVFFRVQAYGIRPKPGSRTGIWLAKKMRVIPHSWTDLRTGETMAVVANLSRSSL